MNHVCRLALAVTLLTPTIGWAQSDSDGDGVNNSADAYPCDPSVAGVAFVPGEGLHGALHFEDQWPSVGDEDFNDLVLTYNYVVRQDAQGRAVAITATFNPLAVGGVFDNALGLHPPVSANAIATVTRTVGNGSPQTLSPSTLDTEFTVTVSANVREFFAMAATFLTSAAACPMTCAAALVAVAVRAAITAAAAVVMWAATSATLDSTERDARAPTITRVPTHLMECSLDAATDRSPSAS